MEWIDGKMETEVTGIDKYMLSGEDLTIVLTGNEMPKSVGKKFKITIEEVKEEIKITSDEVGNIEDVLPELVVTEKKIATTCVLADYENLPCQFMVEGECPNQCEKYSPSQGTIGTEPIFK